MRLPRLVVLVALVAAIAAAGSVAGPYVRAASLVVRAADLGGTPETIASTLTYEVTVQPAHTVPTRAGNVRARFYTPHAAVERTVLLVPGIHSMGIEEPRLTALAADLAATGVTVMTMALPDLQRYRITARSTDVIEDAVTWMVKQPGLAPDGRVGLIGISFAGGLSIVAAGRPSIRDRVAFIVSFGGHGDLRRVMRYLLTGEAPQVEGLESHPPHDYGVAVLLYALAERVVPPEQVAPLRAGIETFLLASQLTLVDMNQANATFARAREMAEPLPEPAKTYLTYVNDRNVQALGLVLLPHLDEANAPGASPERAPSPPSAPVFLLHGDDDTVIPSAETVLLAGHLRERGVDVRVLLSGLITHAEVDRSAAFSETWKLVGFWGDVLGK